MIANYKERTVRPEWVKISNKTDETMKTVKSEKDYVIETIKELKPFMSNDISRPAMCGVFFDPPFAVATNGHYLIQIQGNESAKGIFAMKKGIDDNGNVIDITYGIDEKFPDYANVIPTTNYEPYRVSVAGVMDYLATFKKEVERKCNLEDLKDGIDPGITFKNVKRGVYAMTFHLRDEVIVKYDIRNFETVFKYLKKRGVTTVECSFSTERPDNRGMLLKADGILILLMPLMLGDNFDAKGVGFQNFDMNIIYHPQFSFSLNRVIG